MEGFYTHTTWRVKPGREDDFVERWGEWAEWSHHQGLQDEALLLRDTENPHVFVSFAPWENAAVVRGWRALSGYQERVERLREVLDSFDPETLEVVERR